MAMEGGWERLRGAFLSLHSGDTPIAVVRFEAYKTLYYRLSPATVQEA